jgi:hypothetical protein
MPDLADFFPGGVVRFVPPPFDELYWARFGIPARIRLDAWCGGEAQRGARYVDHGVTVDGEAGARRTFGGGRKARGYSSGDPRA